MTESQAPNGGVPNPGAAGIPFYEKTRQELKSLIARKKLLEKKLVRSPVYRGNRMGTKRLLTIADRQQKKS